MKVIYANGNVDVANEEKILAGQRHVRRLREKYL